MSIYNTENPLAAVPYIFAAQFYREPHLPLEKLKADMPVLKKNGFNAIKIQEAWVYEESVEGKYDFRTMHELAEAAEANGLYIYYTVCLEVPPWAWKKYPDALRIAEDGRKIFSYNSYGYSDGKPGPCWEHKGVRGAAEKFMKTFASELGCHKNIIMWQVFQELNPEGVFCYCPLCIKKYQDWLKERYISIEELNRVWMIKYGDWSEIEPFRGINKSGPAYTDWWRFSREKEADMLKWRADVMRAADPLHRPVSANTSLANFGDDWAWRLADKVEIFGFSLYPSLFHMDPVSAEDSAPVLNAAAQIKNEMWHLCMNFDYARAATGGNQFAMEFQAGPASLGMHYGADPSPEDLQRWLMLALASAIRGVFFWNHRPEFFAGEAFGYGIFNDTMKSSPKTDMMKKIMNAVIGEGDFFKEAVLADTSVAILINDDAYRYHRANGATFCVRPKPDMAALYGVYRLLWNMGVNVDFIAESDMKKGRLKNYKLAIMTFPYAVSDVYAEMLKDYVRDGGTLLSEACPGRVSDRDMVNYETGMAPGFSELFGCSDAGLKMSLSANGRNYFLSPHWYRSFMPSTDLKGESEFDGITLASSVYLESFSLKGGTALFKHGDEVHGVVNKFGKGKAYLIGTLPAFELYLNPSETAFKSVLQRIIKSLGIIQNKSSELIVRRMIKDDKEIRFFINNTDLVQVANVCNLKDSVLEDLLSGEVLNHNFSVNPLSIKALRIIKNK